MPRTKSKKGGVIVIFIDLASRIKLIIAKFVNGLMSILTVGHIFLNVMVEVVLLVRLLFVNLYSLAILPSVVSLCQPLVTIIVKAVMSYTFLLVEFVTFNMLVKQQPLFTREIMVIEPKPITMAKLFCISIMVSVVMIFLRPLYK